ncbi:MAG: hypothetical protein QM692_21050 [Thermomicrobiales bacterium]
MDTATFDTLARALSATHTAGSVSRRAALRGLAGGALAIATGAALTPPATEARRRKGKGKGNKKTQARRPGERCQTTTQCQKTDADFICGQPRIFAAERVCCGGIDALCDETGGSRACCYGYLCASGRCIVV